MNTVSIAMFHATHQQGQMTQNDKVFTRWLLLLGFVLMTGCATLQVTPTVTVTLADEFYEVKACMGLPRGQFPDVVIEPMPERFDCPHYFPYLFACRGEFVAPNIIRLGDVGIWKHEVVHYVLYRNVDDADAPHETGWYEVCAP